MSHRFTAGNRHRLAFEQLEDRTVLSAANIWSIANGVYDLNNTFALHSTPTATKTIYLDFDGYTTGDVTGTSWDNLTSPAWDYSGNGASFTDAEKQIIQRVWARVSEDYAPFNVDVTTQDPGDEALRKSGTGDDRWGIRVVITPDNTPAPGSGGVAYVGSFNYSNLTPAYVFNGSEVGIAEAASHEAGHSLGLGHDGTASAGYYSGQGSGATGWAPIMGASYYKNVTQWSKGEYTGANNAEDDLAKISTQNGFSYLPDDVGSTQATAKAFITSGASSGDLFGVIEQNTDSDWYSFYANAGAISLNATPLALGPNLAIRADLYDAAGNLLYTSNPAGTLNAPINFTLTTAGQYFIKLTGAGRGNPATDGFSNYASLGNYRLSGTVTPYTGGTPTNSPPVANADSVTTAYNTPVTLNVLANDTDPNGDTLTLVSAGSAVGGTVSVSGSSVVFTPTAGFSGNGSFTYVVSDGRGGTATGQASVVVGAPPPASTTFRNDTNVNISSSGPVTVTSSIVVSGLTGTIQDLNVSLNLYHTYDNDVVITLIAPDGTRITLFNRHGGSSDNILGTTFDDSATISIGSASAPFTGTFKPYQLLSALNGKIPNGTWKLEIKDVARYDGGYLDNWTLAFTTTASGAPANSLSTSGTLSALASGVSTVVNPRLPSFSSQLSTVLSTVSRAVETWSTVSGTPSTLGSLIARLHTSTGDHDFHGHGDELEEDLYPVYGGA